jgi:integrase
LRSIKRYIPKWAALQKQTPNEKLTATGETLRNYVLHLANTGIRHSTEALGLHWRIIEWYERDGERYCGAKVDGKNNDRMLVAA